MKTTLPTPSGVNSQRRLLLGAGAAALGSLALPAYAQSTYPTKPIRWIVPYNPGGATDIVARLLADNLSKSLGQRVLVQNTPGAATTIGMRELLNSPADGYTIITADNATLYNNWSLFSDLPYKPDSFDYVAMTGRFPLVLAVSGEIAPNTFQEWVEWARTTDKDKLNYATPGVGSPHHIAMATLLDRLGLTMQHVPYKGDSAAVVDLVSGEAQTMFMGVITANQYKADGRIKLLAVGSPTRLKELPEVPTFAEVGVDNFEDSAEQGVLAPAGLPQDVRQKLNEELGKVLQIPEVVAKLNGLGMYPVLMTPAEFREHVRKQAASAGEVIKRNNITIN